MGHQHGEDFKREAVRLALSSGLPRKRVAADLGIDFSTLGKWISIYRTEARRDEMQQLEEILRICPRNHNTRHRFN